jgi:hypothetical protein
MSLDGDVPKVQDRCVRPVPHSPSPPVAFDEQVTNDLQDQCAPMEDGHKSSLSHSSSSLTDEKQGHTMGDSDDTGTDVDAHVSKTPKLEKKSTQPKAGDFNSSDKELVSVASNIYRMLLASRGSFPNTATEMKLIKKAWKKINQES